MAGWDEEEDALVVLERDNYKVIKRSTGEIVILDFFGTGPDDQPSRRSPSELERYLIEELVERIHTAWEW